jgi:hypothetical protein
MLIRPDLKKLTFYNNLAYFALPSVTEKRR